MHWRPADNTTSQPVATRLPLPHATFASAQLILQLGFVSQVGIGSPFPLDLSIQNVTIYAQELVITVADAAGVVFAGDRVSVVTVLPCSSFMLQLVCVAHLCGLQPVPTVSIASKRFPGSPYVMRGRAVTCIEAGETV